MSDLAPAPTGPLPLAPPGVCAACLYPIAETEAYAYVYASAKREHGLICAVCWNAGRGAFVESGADRRAHPPAPPPAAPKG